MTARLPSISATSSTIDLADWLELSALADRDRNSSIQDLVSEIRRSGTVEAYIEDSQSASDYHLEEPDYGEQDINISVDSGGESAEAIADAAFSEIEARSRAAGSGYAFEVDDDYIQLKPEVAVATSTYIFQLLLSMEGPQEKIEPKLFPERQFESLCVRALQSYLGGVTGTQGFKFGFPREAPYSNFPDAVSHIIHLLGEGGVVRPDPRLQSMRDDKLDVVVSIPFGDSAPSQLIAFGQCATGVDWEDKLGDLYDPAKWCEQWMTDPPVVAPIRTFFIPRCVHYSRWKQASRRGGILFERCRISSKLATLDNTEFASAQNWTERVLRSREFPTGLLDEDAYETSDDDSP
ncbi:MAG: hypothetical protein OXG76_09120 [Acidimicrobiaceae bacterium]|nr:hypothetical protein [Acidimicrobiaceae bacterium]